MTECRIKFAYNIVDQRAGSSDLPLLAVSIHRGVVRRSEITADLPRAEDLSAYKVCKPGDIVLNRMRAFQGAVGVSGEAGLISPDYLILRPAIHVTPRYLHYLFRSTWFVGEMISRLRGIGGTESGMVRTPRINAEDLANIRVELPDTVRQGQTADFLDVETGRIDRLIELRKSQLRTIVERDVSYVSIEAERLAVTYGTVRVRHVMQRIEQGWSPQCEDRTVGPGEWAVLKAGCVNGGRFDPSQHKALPSDIAPLRQYQVHAGDLLVSRASGSLDMIGSAAVLSQEPAEKLLLCDKVYRLIMDRTRMRHPFVAAALGTHAARQRIRLGVSGAQGMANNLPVSVVAGILLPDAPLAVQDQAVGAIETNRAGLTNVKNHLTRQIGVLAERRQALITAAVTGRIAMSTASGVAV